MLTPHAKDPNRKEQLKKKKENPKDFGVPPVSGNISEGQKTDGQVQPKKTTTKS